MKSAFNGPLMSAGLSSGVRDMDSTFEGGVLSAEPASKRRAWEQYYSGRFAPRNTFVNPDIARSASPSVRMYGGRKRRTVS